MASKNLTHNDYTVGWVCALSKEQTAATAMLDEEHEELHKPPNDHNSYTLGRIGKHNIVIACLPEGEIGNDASAAVATRMTSTFPSVKFGLMVGIGGGVPPTVRLGDVVVSTPGNGFGGVVQWDIGKTEQGNTFKRTGALDSPPNALRTALTKLKTKHEMKGSLITQYLEDLAKKWPRLGAKYAKCDTLEDVLFKANYNHVQENSTESRDDMEVDADEGDKEEDSEKKCISCDPSKAINRKPRDMIIHYGLIASGNQVIKDAAFRDEINKRLGGHVLCFEMEAAGLMNDFPCIVIRGICDYADSHKNKDWQEYAAAVAAAFAKEFLSVLPAHEVDQLPLIKILEGISRDVNDLRSRRDNQDHQDIANWLAPADYANQQSDFISRRQEGTGLWLLHSSEYQQWITEERKTLFCPGIPGAGKTTITSIIVEDLWRRFQRENNVGIAYIYCNFRQQHEQTPKDLLASILKQLIKGLPFLPESMKNLYEHHKNRQSRPSIEEICEVLQSVAVNYTKTFIIIDALDECQASDGGREKLLLAIFELQAKSGVNVFATSRFIPEIVRKFEGGISLEIRASSHDVQKFLDGKMSELRPFVLRNFLLQEDIRTAITETADGMFLLAKLHMDSLTTKTTIKAVRLALNSFREQSDALNDYKQPRALDQAYSEAMNRIQGQETDFQQLATRVLSWITCAKRPLITFELQHALAVETGASELDPENIPDIEDVVSVCAGLVTVDKESSIIRLVHYTTQDYFERTHRTWFPNAHTDITMTCITYLSFDVFGTGFCRTKSEFKNRLDSWFLYDYAARNWGHYAQAAWGTAEYWIVRFLKDKAKVSSSSQAMLASDISHSQSVPQDMMGVHIAAIFGLRDTLVTLLKDSQEADIRDTDGRTPLSYAAEKGHTEVVELLLAIDVVDPDSNNHVRTPLSYAAENGHAEIAKLLLCKDGINVNSEAKKTGQTPLSYAAEKGHEEVVKLLLSQEGIDVNSNHVGSGRTPLMLAAKNEHEAVVELLLFRKEIQLDAKDKFGWTVLHLAVQNQNPKLVCLLLENGANVNIETSDWDGWTALHLAVGKSFNEMVILLLQNGASVDCQNRHGSTALHLAVKTRNKEMAELLLKNKANVNVEGKQFHRWTALHIAVVYGYPELVLLLLHYNVNVDAKDASGWTALHLAAVNGDEMVLESLLHKEADVYAKNGLGQTAIHRAAQYGCGEIVQLLLDMGVNVNVQDGNNRTPLDWAIEHGRLGVVQLLRENGAISTTESNRQTLWLPGRGHNEPMPNGFSVRRLRREMADIPSYSQCEIVMYHLGNIDGWMNLKGQFRGPPYTPYEGGVFVLDIEIPRGYPIEPPAIKFETRIWHPNINSETGLIYLQDLSSGWAAYLTIPGMLVAIYSMLGSPLQMLGGNEVIDMQRSNPYQFKRVARDWAIKYAGAPNRTTEFTLMVINDSNETTELDDYHGYNKDLIDRFTGMGFSIERVVVVFESIGVDKMSEGDQDFEQLYMDDILAVLLA